MHENINTLAIAFYQFLPSTFGSLLLPVYLQNLNIKYFRIDFLIEYENKEFWKMFKI